MNNKKKPKLNEKFKTNIDLYQTAVSKAQTNVNNCHIQAFSYVFLPDWKCIFKIYVWLNELLWFFWKNVNLPGLIILTVNWLVCGHTFKFCVVSGNHATWNQRLWFDSSMVILLVIYKTVLKMFVFFSILNLMKYFHSLLPIVVCMFCLSWVLIVCFKV